MNLTFDQIQPHLTERGVIEVELATRAAIIAAQNEVIRRLTPQDTDMAEVVARG